MYRCQCCRSVVPPRTPSHRLIVQTQIAEFPYRVRANRFVRPDNKGKPKTFFVDDPGGTGTQIVREIIACPSCAAARAARAAPAVKT